jgi:hypothetical protein
MAVMRRIAFVLITALAAFFLLWTSAGARDFWDSHYSEWDNRQVLRLLNNSPWARQTTVTHQVGDRTRGYGADKGSGVSGEKELYHTYTVRFFTALPVRQAYVRMLQIMNQYDQMPEAQKRGFDTQFVRALEMDTEDQIIVALEHATNDRNAGMEVNRQLNQANAELLKQSAYLISDRLGRVALKAYFPPSPDGTGAKLVFPRTVDGKPVVGPEDRNVKLEFWVPGTGHKVFVTWRVRQMRHNGELAL